MYKPPLKSRVVVVVIALCLFLDYLLYGVVLPLMAQFPAKITSEEELAFLYGTYAVSVLLLTPLFGYLGTRIGVRATIICGGVLTACTTVLFGVAENFAFVFAARLCQGAASAAIWTGGLALVAEYYVDTRVEMIGYAFTGSTAGSVLGPLIGGVLYRAGGYRLPFIVLSILALLEVLLLVTFLPRQRSRHPQNLNVRGLLSNKSVVTCALAVGLAAFAWGVIEPLLPSRLSGYGAKPEIIGLIFTASSIVYGLCAPLVGWTCERLSVRNVVVLGTVGMAASLPLLACFRGILLTGLALCLVNGMFAFMLNPASAELGNEVDRSGVSSYSAVYAVYNVVYSVGMLATSVLTSAAAYSLGFFRVLLCVSAVLILCTPLLAFANSRVKASAEASTAPRAHPDLQK